MATTIGNLQFNCNTCDTKYYLGLGGSQFTPLVNNTSDQFVSEQKNKNNKRRKLLISLAIISSVVALSALVVAVRNTKFIKQPDKQLISYRDEALNVFNKYLDEKLSKNATLEEIKKSYKILAKKYHPDVNRSSEDIFKEIGKAYKTLTKSLTLH